MPAAPSTHRDRRLRTMLAGVELANPVVLAAGTCGYGPEVADFADPCSIGAVTTKSITRESREGHPPWRIVDVPGGMMNAIGLANLGLDRFLAEKCPQLAALPTVAIGSIAGHGIADYLAVAEAFELRPELPIVEINVSCPNTADGRHFGHDAASLRSLLAALRPVLRTTRMLVKLAPDAPDRLGIAAAAVEAGADGLTVANTWPALSIDVRSRRPRLSAGGGGLSGVAIHPLAVRFVREVHERVAGPAKVPIVGLGGVLDWESAAEFILAGATAVGIGTGLFVDPRIPRRVVRGLDRWAASQGVESIGSLVGAMEP